MRLAIIAVLFFREAIARRWVLAAAIGVTLLLAGIASTLQLEVIDGALAATRLFGSNLNSDIQAADVALRALFRAASYIVFYGGLIFGILVFSDFGPEILAPGRIEQLLAQPVRRWELLLGTFFGAWILAAAGAVYGAGGFAVILGFKTGIWSVQPFVAGLISSVAFAAVYAAMLSSAVFVRSASFSGVIGGFVLLMGFVSSYRDPLSEVFYRGVVGAFLRSVTMWAPRLALLADRTSDLAATVLQDEGLFIRLILSTLLFCVACLCVGIWQFENKDY